MRTRTLTKLVFGGVAAGIALSSAIVVATSVLQTPGDDGAVPTTLIETKADRTVLSPTSEQVARSGKADALDITISILRGSDTVFGDRLAPLPERNITVLQPDPVPQAPNTATVAVEPETPPAEDAASDQRLKPQPSPRVRTLAVTRTGPTNIVPTPAPTDNLPATAPAETTTNFSIDPLETDGALRNRQDLSR